tara:strand:- start:1461 stop:3110 length:1650 start_codon:yes stop_codon:yes gene_type:complete
MAVPTLTPSSTTSAVRLPETGSITSAQTVANYPLGVYADSTTSVYDASFISGAVDQVNYTYRKLGGDVLDIELTQKNIFAAYEESVLEYSYILNIHQAKNSLGSALGGPTGSFDQDGQLSGSEVLSDLGLRLPRFNYGYAKMVGDRTSIETGIGGISPIYSASIDLTTGQQDYDLDNIIRTTEIAATATITALSKTAGEVNTRTLTIYDAESNSVQFTIDNTTDTSTATIIGFSNANSNATQFATNIAAAINAAKTAGTLNISATSSDAVVTLTMSTPGTSGNSVTDIAVTDSAVTITSQFAGGENQYFGPDLRNHANNRIMVRRVYFKTPHSMWRFYGYYGGLNSVGNMSTYGMFADDSTFEVVPPWQNKMQAMAYEDAIYTRNSHYSYEIKNNNLRIYPRPTLGSPSKMYVEFSVEVGAFDTVSGSLDNAARTGINNMNTLPFTNLPYKKINAIGKQWIRRFALSLTKEMLGQVRGKFATIPIPGESVNLNASDLLAQAKEEQEKLREELKTVLDEMTYQKLAEQEATMAKSVSETFQTIPNFIFTG